MSEARQEAQQQAPSLDFPEAFADLFTPSRYKVYYGGRGGAKSWGFARALLIQGIQQPLRTLCAREVQNSITDSVHKLLADQITAMGMNYLYEVQNNTILTPAGTSFVFAGLQRNINSIKSKEGLDRVWVEEAEDTSEKSWETLIPTMRKPGSEIWVSFNPGPAEGYTYQNFVVKPRPDSIVRKVGWRENPWFPQVLMAEMQEMKERDYQKYLNIWEGHCKVALEGAVYAQELAESIGAGRVTKVPYTEGVPVDTYWDLGWADTTAIWMIQKVGFEYRVIDYLSARQRKLPWFVQQLQARKWIDPQARSRAYQWGTHWLPHDSKKNQLGTGMTVQEELSKVPGFRVQVTPSLRIVDGINAVRTIFPRVWFDEEKTAEGLVSLKSYKYSIDPTTKLWSREPAHDAASHAADAFRYFAVANRTPIRQTGRGRALMGR